ncbi:Beta-glucosidase-related glycosidase [Liquorilactobacillus mali]|uniref:beta-glucosidase n=2 Tax=Liquorilactobacillus mali TaxID=1618 RepID=A0A0R2FXG6_9LACO|nr:Beta-glucosidase-related glycosidase [Liquorilactobacillus mali]
MEAGSRMKENELRSLLNDLSLEEKIGQLVQLSGEFFKADDISIGPQQKLGITQRTVDLTGSILNVAGAKVTMDIQKRQMEKQPHHIPVLFMSDVIYGYKTIYPIPLGLGATWNPELIKKAFNTAANEAAAAGNHVTFAPMVDVAHDARWGRVLESPGEDPFLNASFAKNMVEGLQEDLVTGEGQIACVKHFAAYGAVEAGREYNTVDMSQSNLFQNYLPPYKAALDAGAKIVMTALNSLNGVPVTANKEILVDLLRKKWGFDGVVISDYASIYELIKHGFASDELDASQKAFAATVDIDMKSSCYANNLEPLLKSGRISEEKINKATWRVLSIKNELGLFEDPFRGISVEKEKKRILSRGERLLARRVSEESIVMLKNKDNILPLNSSLKIALIGPYSDSQELLGMWAVHGNSKDTVSIKQGFEQYVEKENLLVAKGTDLIDDSKILREMNFLSEEQIEKIVSSENVRKSNEKKAIDVATKSDIVVMVLGEHTLESGEAGSKTNLHLSKNQRLLLKKISKLGKKIVLVVISGRPLVLTDVEPEVDAILEAWFPGTEGGNAIANIVFGKANPSGRLSMSFPYDEGQEPLYYNQLVTGRPINKSQHVGRYVSKYIDNPNAPLYPFGYGLSYSQIEYGEIVLEKNKIKLGEDLRVQIELFNNSVYDSLETVQVYLNDKVASVVQPEKKLIDFKKVHVNAKSRVTVDFTIKPNSLSFFNNNGERLIEKGAFTLLVGRNSVDLAEKNFEVF